MKYKIIILLVAVIILTLSVDRAIIKYTDKPCVPMIVDTPTESPCVTDNNNEQTENDKITYKTFSSPKADFTFEYPVTWVYNEEDIENTIVWSFYSNSEINPGNAVLEVHYPTYETVDFCSVGYKGYKSPYQLNTFPTNDPETYITYEQCGQNQNGDGYIYWQKGEYFANAGLINDILKTNLMIFNYDSKEGKGIAQHIAESIKIK